MYRIAKTFSFAAAHHLPQLPEDHKCRRQHGHNYTVQVELQSEHLDPYGFVLDYGDLAPFNQFLQETLDHRDLNDVLAFGSEVVAFLPTAENLAGWLFGIALDLLGPDVVAVRVSETPNTWAEYRQ